MSSPVPSRLGSDKARFTCISCKFRKKKCDKSMPTCSLCERKKWKCEYSSPKVLRRSPAFDNLPAKSQVISSQHIERQTQQPDLAAVYFLDADLFRQSRLQLPNITLPIAQQVRDLLGDMTSFRSLAIEYFRTVHKYMPIVSKQIFFGRLLNPLHVAPPEVYLLFLCMRLIMTPPVSGYAQSKTALYLHAKSYHSNLEDAGSSSVHLLQSNILISLYEVGHAIYPAALRSIGSCVTFARAFDMDGCEVVGNLDWIEIEEIRRIWWAIIILDRFATLGNPSRSLATENPPMTCILPMDDDVWDTGDSPCRDNITLSSPMSIKMGRFARFSQAAHLLG